MVKEIANIIETQEWYQEMILELKATFDKAFFNSRWELIEGYHQAGKVIIGAKDNFEKVGIKEQDILQRIAKSMDKSERMIYYAVALVEKYPDLDKLSEGKNISMHKIITKYLTNKESHICDFQTITIQKCKCGKTRK